MVTLFSKVVNCVQFFFFFVFLCHCHLLTLSNSGQWNCLWKWCMGLVGLYLCNRVNANKTRKSNISRFSHKLATWPNQLNLSILTHSALNAPVWLRHHFASIFASKSVQMQPNHRHWTNYWVECDVADFIAHFAFSLWYGALVNLTTKLSPAAASVHRLAITIIITIRCDAVLCSRSNVSTFVETHQPKGDAKRAHGIEQTNEQTKWCEKCAERHSPRWIKKERERKKKNV